MHETPVPQGAEFVQRLLQRLDALTFLGHRPGTLPAVMLGLSQPVAQRLAAAADLSRDRADRRPLRSVFARILAHQARRQFANLGAKRHCLRSIIVVATQALRPPTNLRGSTATMGVEAMN